MLEKQPALSFCNNVQYMILLDMVVCQYTIRNLSPPQKKQFQFLNF